MYIVAGLGNPGAEYATTRHNIGFMALDQLCATLPSCGFTASRWGGDVVKTRYVSESVVLVKPTTYMNLSGQCIGAVAQYYKVPSENIIVIHDDLDLDLGRVKLCQNRGHGGHNGLKSIVSHLGTKDFKRVRLGIGRNPQRIPVEKYVLGQFSKDDRSVIPVQIDLAVEGVELILAKGMAEAMQTIHSRKP